MRSRSATVKRKSSRFKFFGDTIAELKKVVWLTRQEVIYLTTMVIIVAAIVGLILGILDYGFSKLINNLFLGG